MRIIGFGTNAVTVELDPGDCFLLAEACRETHAVDRGTDQPRLDLMEQAMILAAMAAATWDESTGNQQRTIAAVRAAWLPPHRR